MFIGPSVAVSLSASRCCASGDWGNPRYIVYHGLAVIKVGDCDRPLVTGRVYNGRTQPHWHSNGLLSGYKSKEYQGSGYNQMVMDDSTGQNRVQLYSTSSNSQLHLGYLVDQSGNTRGSYLGSGFDLKSDAYGAVRAGQGLYVNTCSATSQPLDARETTSQLVNSESVLEAMSDASTTHQAESLKDGYDSLKSFTDATQNSVPGSSSGGNTAGGGTGSANAFKEPVMLFGSPSGIALSSQKSIHIASDAQTNLVSGQSTHIATGKSLIASVAEKISLFVQNAGMKLFAAKGKVEIQAQSDNIELVAQKTVRVLSATEKIEAAAKQEILLTSGGAYIRIKDGNIEIHAPGKIDIKGSQHSFAGPASMGYALPSLSSLSSDEEIVEQSFVLLENGTTPVEGYHYDLYSDGDLHTKKGQYSSGETVSISGQSSLKLVTWIAGDSARKRA
jgi:type VI secretion system secreted protein VgrG